MTFIYEQGFAVVEEIEGMHRIDKQNSMPSMLLIWSQHYNCQIRTSSRALKKIKI